MNLQENEVFRRRELIKCLTFSKNCCPRLRPVPISPPLTPEREVTDTKNFF